MLRLIDSGVQNASHNMAIDETLAISLGENPETGFLRFYRWSPPALSFGYFQNIEKILNLEKLAASEIQAVRRMTGGKMVFHRDEITFSAGIFLNRIRRINPDSKNFADFFKEVMIPFVQGLRRTGIDADFAKVTESAKTDKFLCFSSAVGHSIFSGGKKLVGAAGVIKGEILCFHGSMPISLSPLPQELLLNQTQIVHSNHGCLRKNLDETQISNLPGTIAEAFAGHFDFSLQRSSLNREEERISQILSEAKYGNLFWNQDKAKHWESKIKRK